MENEKVQEGLLRLAKEYGLTVIEEVGTEGPAYRLLSRKDADIYLALVYGYVQPRLH